METAAQPWVLPLCQAAAFWVALLGFRGQSPRRFILGLAAGALLARFGWLFLHFPVLSGELPFLSPRPCGPGAEELAWWLGPGAGLSILFVPLGPLALAPWRRGSHARLVYGVAACRALAPAFAVARLGCVFAGCCSGVPLAGEGGFAPPTALCEALGWGLVSAALARAAPCRVPGLFLAAFGALRLVTEPWRAPPPLGEPVLDPAWLALAWLLAGILALWGASTGGKLPTGGRRAADSKTGPAKLGGQRKNTESDKKDNEARKTTKREEPIPWSSS
jgi:hypothetical protein